MLARFQSVTYLGIEIFLVDVEVDVKEANHFSLVIVGLPDNAVKESKDRVTSAIKNSGFQLPSSHCTVNLAPGDLKKEGALYDLPIALALLKSHGILKETLSEEFLTIGELSLSGHTRKIPNALPFALFAKQIGKKGILIPKGNIQEASLVSGLSIIGVETLVEACQILQNPKLFTSASFTSSSSFKSEPTLPCVDFKEIKGQLHVKRALEIAASGGHNVLMFGPPGSGKTLFAKALTGILPPLCEKEAIEVTKIHALAGLLKDTSHFISIPPFRSPHHTISPVGLVGGGSKIKPGEISLAHRGILFLDELPEFSRNSLEVLRQPLENRTITISRASGSITFPTDFIFLAAMNPCPCGFLGHPKKGCKDTPSQIHRYRNKISGPLLDRIDLHLEVPVPSFDDLQQSNFQEESKTVQGRVIAARKIQEKRFKTLRTNASMAIKEISTFCNLNPSCISLLREASETWNISARGLHRLLKVARTIGDLASAEEIQEEHLMEALSFRL